MRIRIFVGGQPVDQFVPDEFQGAGCAPGRLGILDIGRDGPTWVFFAPSAANADEVNRLRTDHQGALVVPQDYSYTVACRSSRHRAVGLSYLHTVMGEGRTSAQKCAACQNGSIFLIAQTPTAPTSTRARALASQCTKGSASTRISGRGNIFPR